MSDQALKATLEEAASKAFACSGRVDALRRLPGGSSRETWSFDFVGADGRRHSLILRRDPGGHTHDSLTAKIGAFGIDREVECALLRAVVAAGVPAPGVRFSMPESAGGGFVMDRLEGETSARRIQRSDELAAARLCFAADCGRALAAIHRTPKHSLPKLPRLGLEEQLRLYRQLLDHLQVTQPVFEYALNWLEQHRPAASADTLVHGDFRLGNLMVAGQGLVAALDWELSHLGDPMEDLGWLCVRSWRFGGRMPVGGIGSRDELYEAYEAAGGGVVDPVRARYWEIFGTLKWGEICLIQTFTHLLGYNRSVDLAAVGRRVSETEYDLLQLLELA